MRHPGSFGIRVLNLRLPPGKVQDARGHPATVEGRRAGMNRAPYRLYYAVAVVSCVRVVCPGSEGLGGRTHRLSQGRLSLLSKQQLAAGDPHVGVDSRHVRRRDVATGGEVTAAFNDLGQAALS